ncbi:MAG: hypothetical protein ABI488_17315 [Polyangiaceae bacterium]
MIGKQLAWSALGLLAALGLALCAVHWYQPPRLGSSGRPFWLERDFLCAFASSALALAVAVSSTRAALSAGALGAGSVFLRALVWSGLTLLFIALWSGALSMLTLLVAPTHAFAGLRVLALWTKWRSDVNLNR